ncbi:MAG: hypothetical protein IT328_04560 [Caldilineaceae bacterium]|nr:hypothetical protein [Caldilineaceae bacterium]
MIKELLADGSTEAQVLAVLVANGFDAIEAQFAIDLELGRQEGDNLVVDADGEESAVDALILEPLGEDQDG